MARCTVKTNLEVHHKRRNRGNDLDNAEVLCQGCHENTASYGKVGEKPEPFPKTIKAVAMALAKNQCECTRKSCGAH